jgi:5-methylcytosine-specific restriction endonuclease McrA
MDEPQQLPPCDFCGSVISRAVDVIRNPKSLARAKEAFGKSGSAICHPCMRSANLEMRVTDGAVVRLAVRVDKETAEGDFSGAKSALPALDAAVEGGKMVIKRLMKQINRLAKDHAAIIEYRDRIEARYAKWLFDSYPARRSRANYRISKIQLRLAVFHRDGHACVRCKSKENLTMDHIVPVKLGGSDDIENLQALCKPCNSSKGARAVNFMKTPQIGDNAAQ